MKRTLIALAGLILVIASAGPALAKGPLLNGAQLVGPGMKGPMTFGDPSGKGGTHSDGDVNLLARNTKLLETLYEGDQISAPAQSVLGPRYTIVWTMRREVGSHQTFDLRSNLYPYAKGGIFIHTLGGQRIHMGDMNFTLRGGWASGNPVLKENLQGWGLPKAPRSLDHVTPAATTAPPLWIIPAALLALIVVAGVRAKRRATTVRTA